MCLPPQIFLWVSLVNHKFGMYQILTGAHFLSTLWLRSTLTIDYTHPYNTLTSESEQSYTESCYYVYMYHKNITGNVFTLKFIRRSVSTLKNFQILTLSDTYASFLCLRKFWLNAYHSKLYGMHIQISRHVKLAIKSG